MFINNAITGETINIWGNGEVVRDYIYIKDAVKVLADSIRIKSDSKIFNLSSGKGHSLNQIIDLIKDISGREIKVEYKEGRNVDVPVNILDNRLAQNTFGWKPETDIKKGIELTYKYLEKLNVR